MRASEAEIFGTPDPVKSAEYEGIDPAVKPVKDLTTSRLQSELYRKSALWVSLIEQFLGRIRHYDCVHSCPTRVSKLYKHRSVTRDE
jgi:hypothetical protein